MPGTCSWLVPIKVVGTSVPADHVSLKFAREGTVQGGTSELGENSELEVRENEGRRKETERG